MATVSWLFPALVVVGLIAVGIRYHTVNNYPDDTLVSDLQVQTEPVEVGTVITGEPVEMSISVVNRGSRGGRVLNVAEVCVVGGCFKNKLHEPLTVESGKQVGYPCLLYTNSDGAFRLLLTMFLDNNGTRQVTVCVHGVSVASVK
jgi:hypothetical protein